tara:strand:+ start:8625 stop:9020 length:396 start_codon:yes stop_codon:yes gene_type:complete
MKDNTEKWKYSYPYQTRIATIEQEYGELGQQVPAGFYFRDGEIIRALLDFVKQSGPCTWTEMSMEYHYLFTNMEYHPVNHRGGSFSSGHYRSLMTPRRRRIGNGNYEYIRKGDDGLYRYHTHALGYSGVNC